MWWTCGQSVLHFMLCPFDRKDGKSVRYIIMFNMKNATNLPSVSIGKQRVHVTENAFLNKRFVKYNDWQVLNSVIYIMVQ